MNPRINQLVKSLLQKDTLDQCTLPELQQFAERHPYFGAAQLLLTKKMQTDSPEKYDEQLQKTFLFFHNPLWVEHLLNDTGNATISTSKKEPVADVAPAPEAEILVVEQPEESPLATASPEFNHPEPESTDPVAEQPMITPVTHEIPETISQETQTIEPALELPQIKTEPATDAKTDLIFEPYHTVDYFASQGIKFREEEKPKDKFGQQLKSFTEWLKTMKRLPVNEIAQPAEPATERKVEEMAEKSLQEREVLTEAMAEVWEKQGNTDKAIEVYRKLSLLEPSKNTYFAAKIEGLKKTI